MIEKPIGGRGWGFFIEPVYLLFLMFSCQFIVFRLSSGWVSVVEACFSIQLCGKFVLYWEHLFDGFCELMGWLASGGFGIDGKRWYLCFVLMLCCGLFEAMCSK